MDSVGVPTRLRSRMMELLYASGGDTAFTISQLATILAAAESEVQHEARYNNAVTYNLHDQTVRLRHRRAELQRQRTENEAADSIFSDGGAGVKNHSLYDFAGAARAHRWEEPTYSSGGGGGGGALRRRGGARTMPRRRGNREDKLSAFPKGQVGRVGYVCVADEFNLGELEAHYRALNYFTKFDFDVLHVRFADEEMKGVQASNVGGAGSGGGGAGGANHAVSTNAQASVSATVTAVHDAIEEDNWNYGSTASAVASAPPLLATPPSTIVSGLSHNTTSTTPVTTEEASNGKGVGPNTMGGSGDAMEGRAADTAAAVSGRSAATATGGVTAVAGSSTDPELRSGFDLFIFEYGAVVWWGFDQRYFRIVENDFMLPDSAIAKFITNRYPTKLVNENYPVWCTYNLIAKERLEADDDFKRRLRFDHFLIPYGQGDVNTCGISMLCASHALAQSAKIDYLEIKVQELTENCSPLPRELREKGSVTISERRLLQLRGEVLSYRLMLKSGSDLLDEPDLFWENAYLKPVFQATKEGFEISERVEALDNKLDATNEILSILADEFSQRHGARLEWIVIWLVFVEVIIGALELLVDARPWLLKR